MLWPSIPNFSGGGLGWTIALLGGIGGTVTVLCYGYWIREKGRNAAHDLPICRFDLAVGYVVTAIFGVAMVIIGSQIGDLEGKGATLIIKVAALLEERFESFGWIAKWAFLLGAWGAVFSSLLGVWQSVPYLFTDFWRLSHGLASPRTSEGYSNTSFYRWHLVALATLPISGLFVFDFSLAMKVYGIVGAGFIPMLAVALLLLNGRSRLVGESMVNSKLTTVVLFATLLFFLAAFGLQVQSTLFPTQ